MQARLVQKISRALPAFRGESKLSTWIYRIATNAALDKLRSPFFKRIAQAESLTRSEESGDSNANKEEVIAQDSSMREHQVKYEHVCQMKT